MGEALAFNQSSEPPDRGLLSTWGITTTELEEQLERAGYIDVSLLGFNVADSEVAQQQRVRDVNDSLAAFGVTATNWPERLIAIHEPLNPAAEQELQDGRLAIEAANGQSLGDRIRDYVQEALLLSDVDDLEGEEMDAMSVELQLDGGRRLMITVNGSNWFEGSETKWESDLVFRLYR